MAACVRTRGHRHLPSTMRTSLQPSSTRQSKGGKLAGAPLRLQLRLRLRLGPPRGPPLLRGRRPLGGGLGPQHGRGAQKGERGTAKTGARGDPACTRRTRRAPRPASPRRVAPLPPPTPRKARFQTHRAQVGRAAPRADDQHIPLLCRREQGHNQSPFLSRGPDAAHVAVCVCVYVCVCECVCVCEKEKTREGQASPTSPAFKASSLPGHADARCMMRQSRGQDPTSTLLHTRLRSKAPSTASTLAQRAPSWHGLIPHQPRGASRRGSVCSIGNVPDRSAPSSSASPAASASCCASSLSSNTWRSAGMGT
jgi:hypothetical protein